MVDSKTHHGPSSCGDDDASASSCEAEPQPEKQAASAPWSVVDALLGVALAGAIVGLVLAAYAPMLDAYLGWGLAGEWDDRSNFLENELVRKPLSRELLGKMFTAERVNVFEPLGWLLKALVQRATADLEEASGLLTVNAWCHRMATLGLHAACGVALFAVCAAVLEAAAVGDTPRRRRVAAAAAAACWALHPVHVEVVGWTSAQPYPLAAAFMLAALWTHVALLRAERRGGRTAILRVVGPALYLCATLSKSVTIPAPAAVFALDLVLIRARALRARAGHLLGYAAVTAAMVPVTLRANRLGHDPDADVIRLDRVEQRVAKGLVTIFFCLSKAAYPAKLSPHYTQRDLYFEPGHDDSEVWVAAAAFVFLSGAAAARWAAGVDRGAALAAWVHVVAMFLPTCGLIQHGMIQKGGDRYLYLPSLAMAPLAAASLASSFDAGAARRRPRALVAGLVALVGFAAALGAAAKADRELCQIWRNDVVLLEHCVRADPYDWRCLDTYAEYLLHHGDNHRSSADLLARGLRAVEDLRVPRNPKVMVFRGKCLLLLGQSDEGCRLMHEVTELYPHAPYAWNNAAICDLIDPALRDFQGDKFQRALDLAVRHEHKSAAARNLEVYAAWRDGGYHGQFDGTLVY